MCPKARNSFPALGGKCSNIVRKLCGITPESKQVSCGLAHVERGFVFYHSYGSPEGEYFLIEQGFFGGQT